MSFPTKEERSRCWDARDKYWNCLDHNGSNKDNVCKEFRKLYEGSCSTQWVKHFDRKRSYLKFKDKIEKEGIPNKNGTSLNEPRRIYQQIVCQ